MSSKEYQETMKRAYCYDIAERYEDMAEEMKRVVRLVADEKNELSVAARNYFSLAFKNIVSTRRSSWRVLYAEKQKTEESQEDTIHIIEEILEKVKSELLGYCDEVLNIIDECVLPGIDKCTLAHNVFFLKMKGDYYRYKAEILKDEKQNAVAAQALESYTKAKELADGLSLTDPIRLGLCLNFSVFQYEIMDDIDKACQIAKTAFDAAISELDILTEDNYKDSTLIMQLLRDNLTLWTSRSDGARLKDDNIEVS